jgi:hypothetical protein
MAWALAGCNNELDVNAPAKDIYVVFGVLDPDKPVQEIRIQKAFLTEGNAIEYGANNDISLKNATVTLTCDGCTPFTLLAKDTVKAEGDFYRPHTLYVTRPEDRLVPGNSYTLRVSLPGQENIITATTVVPTRPRITQPDSLQPGTEGLSEQYATAAFNARNFTIRFVPRAFFATGAIGVAFELRIFFDYASNGVAQPQLRFGPGNPYLLRSNGQGEIILGQAFQAYLSQILAARHSASDQLTFDDSNKAESCRIEIAALDRELYNYMRVNSPAFVDFNTISPEYTNIKGGFGILGASTRTSRYVRLQACTKYLARLNNTPVPPGDCPDR